MMYKERFIAVIKHNGKILRERNDFVTLPFGSEYSILLKNLESRNAVVSIFVDGKDVLDYNSLIIGSNSSMTLKGFMKGTKVTNKFKFIKKTKDIQDYRGDRIDDGLVRVEFRFEKKEVTEIVKTEYWHRRRSVCPLCGCSPCECYKRRWPDIYWIGGNVKTSDWSDHEYTYTSSFSCNNLNDANTINCFHNSAPADDEGITVKGSKTNQNFSYGSTKELEEQSSVIIIRLQGTKSNGTIIKKPLTVKSKLRCPTCGKKSKSSVSFCSGCGTCLN